MLHVPSHACALTYHQCRRVNLIVVLTGVHTAVLLTYCRFGTYRMHVVAQSGELLAENCTSVVKQGHGGVWDT